MQYILKAYTNKIKISVSLAFILSLLFNCASNGQNINESKSLIQPKSTIVLYEAPGGSFSEYYFYDDAGSLVKKMRHDQFKSKHPIFKLNFPKSKIGNSEAKFFEDLVTFSASNNKLEPKINPDKKLSELRSLKRYGLIVKTPEKATTIIGHPTLDQRPIISKPANKFLIKIETARILDTAAKENLEGKSNSLLDCSYMTIYDYKGRLFDEFLVPNKIVTSASISDDGKYLLCICEYSAIWDEGLDSKPDGVLIVNLKTKETNYIVTSETKNPIDISSIIFGEKYFQMTFDSPWSGGRCYRLYVNPYNRKFYFITYEVDTLKQRIPIFARPFEQFKGIIESPTKYNEFTY